MAITLAGLKTKVLNTVNESSGSPHSDTQVYECINFAQRDVGLWINSVSKTYLQKSATIAVTAGVAALPTDFDMLVSVETSDGKILNEIPVDERKNGTGYVFMHTNLLIYPTTLATSIVLYYVPLLAELTVGGADSELPDEFEPMLYFLAAAELNRRLNDYDAFRAAMEMYERQQLRMQPRVKRQTQRGGRVRDSKTLRTIATS